MSYPASGEWFNERRWDRANTSTERSGGPERTKVGEEDPEFKPRPVGFTAAIEPVEVEPQTWDGDNA